MSKPMDFTFYAGFTEMCCAKGFVETVKYAAAQGFTSVEPLENTSGQTRTVRNAAEARELRYILADYGLHVACYSVGTSIYRNPAAVDSLCRQLELAAEMGSPFFHHTIAGGVKPGTSFADILPELTDGACRVAEAARSYGIRCIYEDQGYYVNGVAPFGQFFHSVHASYPETAVCGDLGNISFVDETAVDFYTAYAPHIVHVHCKDYRIHETGETGLYQTAHGKYLENTLPGTGIVDYRKCFSILRNNGYTGAFSLELEGFTETEDVLTDGIAHAMHYCRSIWEAVCGS